MANLTEHQSGLFSDYCDTIVDTDTSATSRFCHIIMTRMSMNEPLTAEDVVEILCYNFAIFKTDTARKLLNEMIGKIPIPNQLLCKTSAFGTDAIFMLIYSYFKRYPKLCQTQHNPLEWVSNARRYKLLKELGFTINQIQFNNILTYLNDVCGCKNIQMSDKFNYLVEVMQDYPNFTINTKDMDIFDPEYIDNIDNNIKHNVDKLKYLIKQY